MSYHRNCFKINASIVNEKIKQILFLRKYNINTILGLFMSLLSK